MNHSTWLRRRLFVPVLKTAHFPGLSHNFPWAAYSWSATCSLLLNQKLLLTKTVYTRFKSTCNADLRQALFLVFLWREPGQLPATQKKMYTWGAAGLRTWEVIAEVLQPCLSEHAFSKDTLQYSLAHLYLLGLAYPDPRSCNSKNVPFMQCAFVSVCLLCVLCMLLVAVATQLFSYSSQTTVAQSEFGFITALHCIMLATILPLQSSILFHSARNVWRYE